MLEPLTFRVIASAPPKRPRSTSTADERYQSSENWGLIASVLTHAIRTALASIGLESMLLAIQNAFRRAVLLRRNFAARIPRSVIHSKLGSAHPFARLALRDAPSRVPRFRAS